MAHLLKDRMVRRSVSSPLFISESIDDRPPNNAFGSAETSSNEGDHLGKVHLSKYWNTTVSKFKRE